MSVEKCYTDFHVDFGGTSVWYHVLKGQKIFWMIEPSPTNMRLYEEFVRNPEQTGFFGNVVDKWWIHAVYTPSDSLVFGGNFLHSLRSEMQIQVYLSENRINITKKFRFPYIEELMLYVIADFVFKCTGRRYVRPARLDKARFDYVGKFWKEKGNHRKVINYHDYMNGGIQLNPKDLLAVSNQSEIQDNGVVNVIAMHAENILLYNTAAAATAASAQKPQGQEFFDEKMLPLCLNWLCDHVYAIREATTSVLTELTKKFGGDWASKNIMPKLVTMSKDLNYLHRMTCLFCLNSPAEAVGPQQTAKEIMPIIKELSEDNVPNVRFGVAKGLQKIGKVVDASVLQNEIKPILILVMLLLLPAAYASYVPNDEDRPLNMKVRCETTALEPARDPVGYCISALAPAVYLLIFMILKRFGFGEAAPPQQAQQSSEPSSEPHLTTAYQPPPQQVVAGSAGAGIPLPAPAGLPMLTSGGCASAHPSEVNIGNPWSFFHPAVYKQYAPTVSANTTQPAYG